MNLNVLREVVSIFERSTIGCLEVEENGMKIKLLKAGESLIHSSIQPRLETQMFQPSASPMLTEQATDIERLNKEEYNKEELNSNDIEKVTLSNSNYMVKAPLVGIYYGAATPDDKPFVQLGESVKRGDVLCILEAMKMMNEVIAPVNGKVVKIYFSNEDLVEYNAPIIEIEEDHV